MEASKVGRDHAFQLNGFRRAISSGVWLRVLIAAALGLMAAILFIHLFVVIVLGGLLMLVAYLAVQRAMGPGTRIRLRVPPALSARLKGWMWRK